MKKFIYPLVFVFSILFIGGDLLAQSVTISGEVRPRYEYRHGYKTLFPDGEDAASFISQRTRLNAFYGNSTFKFGLVIQNVSVWGDVAQLNKSSLNGTAIHQAWGQVTISEKLSVKLGRQEIVYDDQRIFGSVGWAQQARSHDAAIIKYVPNKNHRIDIGLAFNANGETLYKTDYTGSYKAFQYLWYHGTFDKVGISFLALNNGVTYTDPADTTQKVAYSQTVGPRLTYKGGNISANAAFYYQGGKNNANNSTSAMYFSANAAYKFSKKFSLGIDGEYLSGTSSQDRAAGETDKSFKPLYGTNHKFNGWMDYFYVGSYMTGTGLVDINLPIIFKVEKFTFKLIPHYFMAAATVGVLQPDGTWKDYSNGLGTEIDFTVGYAVSKSMVISGGYSQMFATETMQVIKGGNYENTNNWAWVMFTFKPTFYKSK
ncbi:MAG: hypothetical protein QM503_00630 [Bacteroidota bacterium]